MFLRTFKAHPGCRSTTPRTNYRWISFQPGLHRVALRKNNDLQADIKTPKHLIMSFVYYSLAFLMSCKLNYQQVWKKGDSCVVRPYSIAAPRKTTTPAFSVDKPAGKITAHEWRAVTDRSKIQSQQRFKINSGWKKLLYTIGCHNPGICCKEIIIF